MRFSVSAALLAGASMASGAVLPAKEFKIPTGAPALPMSTFETHKFEMLTPEQMQEGLKQPKPMNLMSTNAVSTMATCGNLRFRREWDSLNDASKQNWVDSIKCMMSRPASGQFAQSRTRYEDFVALHQNLKDNVHENSKFLVWHRYYLWTFEQALRSECGFTAEFPWFDETKWPGRWSQSSVFSSRWLGGIGIQGRCVTDGQFANLAINVGPGTSNTPHCLARNGDGALTGQITSQNVNGCNGWGTYREMAQCSELGPHGYGHNGVGMVMRDPWAAPADPFFWLHHGFIDRNFRVWQNANLPSRVNNIDGTDRFGNPLTLDMNVSVNGLRPDVKIRDILDTTGTLLCYRYDY